jgi:hypothetical protein
MFAFLPPFFTQNQEHKNIDHKTKNKQKQIDPKTKNKKTDRPQNQEQKKQIDHKTKNKKTDRPQDQEQKNPDRLQNLEHKNR